MQIIGNIFKYVFIYIYHFFRWLFEYKLNQDIGLIFTLIPCQNHKNFTITFHLWENKIEFSNLISSNNSI